MLENKVRSKQYGIISKSNRKINNYNEIQARNNPPKERYVSMRRDGPLQKLEYLKIEM